LSSIFERLFRPKNPEIPIKPRRAETTR